MLTATRGGRLDNTDGIRTSSDRVAELAKAPVCKTENGESLCGFKSHPYLQWRWFESLTCLQIESESLAEWRGAGLQNLIRGFDPLTALQFFEK